MWYHIFQHWESIDITIRIVEIEHRNKEVIRRMSRENTDLPTSSASFHCFAIWLAFFIYRTLNTALTHRHTHTESTRSSQKLVLFFQSVCMHFSHRSNGINLVEKKPGKKEETPTNLSENPIVESWKAVPGEFSEAVRERLYSRWNTEKNAMIKGEWKKSNKCRERINGRIPWTDGA